MKSYYTQYWVPRTALYRHAMNTFTTVTDETLVERIASARERVVFVSPGVTEGVANALTRAHCNAVATTVILDSGEDAYRVGFGDLKGITALHDFVEKHRIPLRQQAGLRIGLLVTDGVAAIWSPTPRSVERDRKSDEPNAIVLETAAAGQLVDAIGVGQPHVLPEIGTESLPLADTDKTVRSLKENPPAPFDLAQKTRVFSTRFQFVETELKGAEWTKRSIKISSFLLNPDLDKALQDILETRIQPYQTKVDDAIETPCIIRGQLAYNQKCEPIHVPTTQKHIEDVWSDIKHRYLVQLPGFGWLIRKKDLPHFRAEVKAFEYVLNSWVKGFRQNVEADESKLVSNIVACIEKRITHSTRISAYKDINLTEEVRRGLEKMRVIEPNVRIVLKDVSWESTRDEEFTRALQVALPPGDLQGWFEEFTAARERSSHTGTEQAL